MAKPAGMAQTYNVNHVHVANQPIPAMVGMPVNVTHMVVASHIIAAKAMNWLGNPNDFVRHKAIGHQKNYPRVFVSILIFPQNPTIIFQCLQTVHSISKNCILSVNIYFYIHFTRIIIAL